jgi:hypothetical protein
MWKECESYKHKCAKEIVKGWIDSKLEIPTNYETNSSVYKLGSQSRNRDEVWLEYPVGYYKENDYNSLDCMFDEHWDECAGYTRIGEECVETNYNPVPTYKQCMKNNFNVVAVLDIAVQHKGCIFQGIEICHKNPVSDKKVQKLKEIGLNELVEIDADWVLNQIGIPKEIQIKRLLI